MADYINNLAAADQYTPALTLGPNFDADAVVITVANNGALMQFAVGTPGSWRWTDEREYFTVPQSFKVGRIVGVRFRNAIPGQPARVLATLYGPDDIEFESGIQFTGVLSASGAVTAPTAPVPTITLVINATPQALPNNAPTRVLLDTVESVNDPNGVFAFDPATSLLTINTVGVYLVTGFVVFAANANGTRNVTLLNAGGEIGLGSAPGARAAAGGAGIVPAAAGNQMELDVLQDSGAALNLLGARLAVAKLS